MRTFLRVKHFSRDGLLLPDSYEGYSQSWTRKFIELLYLHHANILTGAPYTFTDILGSPTRTADGDASSNLIKGNLRVIGPGGNAGVLVANGSNGQFSGPVYCCWYDYNDIIPGHYIGIQIGRGATAATPGDTMMVDKIHHGTRGSIAATSLIEAMATGDTNDGNYTNTGGSMGILYRPLRSCTIYDIQFKMWRTGSPGTVTANVIAVAGGTSLTSDTTILATSNGVNANLWGSASPGAWITFTFPSPIYLQAGFLYFIYITPTQVSGGNLINWRYNAAAAGSHVFGLTSTSSPPSGPSLSATGIALWQIDGAAGAEMEYGGTDLYGYVVSNPTAVFNLRRIFMNNSGEAITVQEAGIYMPMTHRYAGFNGQSYDLSWVACAARDTFAGIVVNNGESLEVDYTPSIHI
jgi:hypothetical protein